MSYRDDLIETDISAYLNAQENKSFLRFITCGSVDDGKSTLIGRLLYDSKLIYEDQLVSIKKESKNRSKCYFRSPETLNKTLRTHQISKVIAKLSRIEQMGNLTIRPRSNLLKRGVSI